MTPRMLVSSISVNSAVATAAAAGGVFTADTVGVGGPAGDGVGAAGANFGGRSTECVTG